MSIGNKRMAFWRKKCYNACAASYIEKKEEEKKQAEKQRDDSTEAFDPSLAEPTQKAGMSTGALVGVTLGGLAVLGTIAYLIFRKKS